MEPLGQQARFAVASRCLNDRETRVGGIRQLLQEPRPHEQITRAQRRIEFRFDQLHRAPPGARAPKPPTRPNDVFLYQEYIILWIVAHFAVRWNGRRYPPPSGWHAC